MIEKLGITPLIFCYLLAGCALDKGDKSTQLEMTPYNLYLPVGFAPPAIPDDNLLTEERIALGKLLFHDKRFSSNGQLSCSSCHQQSKGFADNKDITPGTEGRLGFRNAPTLTNVAYRPSLFMDGGVPNLELQVLAPLDDVNEFDKRLTLLSEELQADEALNEMSRKAYGRDMDPFVITRALAAFERTLISGNSTYDRYKNGDSLLFSPLEKEGMQLFFDERTQCATCHSGQFFSDETFRNIGLYDHYEDKGRERVTADTLDNGKFKVPTLRNVELTGPYMHNGSINTLEEVVQHFSSGGSNHANKDSLIHPLHLSEHEQLALVSFLKTLTDREFIEAHAFAP